MFKELLAAFIFACFILALLVSHQSDHPHKRTVHLTRLKQKCEAFKCLQQFAYERDNTWWYYSVTTDGGPTRISTGLPDGGTWSKGARPENEEIDEADTIGSVEIVENEEGPSTESADTDSSGGGDGGGDD